MVVVGLTGGIATGKTVVSQRLAELGGIILNADQVGHEAYRPHTEVWEEVVRAFGREIVTDGDEIDRRKLGGIVFSDPAKLQLLNSIMHPRMYKMMEVKIDELRRQGAKVVVLEAAILIEANWTPLADQVWVTVAPEEVVIQRLKDRNGWTEEQSRARINAQMPSSERAKHGHVVIDTNCSLDEVRAKVDAEWQKLLSASRGEARG